MVFADSIDKTSCKVWQNVVCFDCRMDSHESIRSWKIDKLIKNIDAASPEMLPALGW